MNNNNKLSSIFAKKGASAANPSSSSLVSSSSIDSSSTSISNSQSSHSNTSAIQFSFQFDCAASNNNGAKKSSKSKKKKKKAKKTSGPKAAFEDANDGNDEDIDEGGDDVGDENDDGLMINPILVEKETIESNETEAEDITPLIESTIANALSEICITPAEDLEIDDGENDGDDLVGNDDEHGQGESKKKKKKKPKKKKAKKESADDNDSISNVVASLTAPTTPAVYWRSSFRPGTSGSTGSSQNAKVVSKSNPTPVKESRSDKPKASSQTVSKSPSQSRPATSATAAKSMSSTPNRVVSFVSPKDSELDEAARLKLKFGTGKNLVAIGPPKRRGVPAWSLPPPGFTVADATNKPTNAADTSKSTKGKAKATLPVQGVGASIVENPSSSSAAVGTLHSSPFSFGFGF